MAISFVGSYTGTHAATSAQTVNFSNLRDESNNAPTLQENDWVYVAVEVASTVDRTQAQLTPSGYTAVHTDDYRNDSNDSNLLVSRKLMGSTPDSSVAIPASNATTAGVAYTIYVFRGVDTTTPEDVAPVVTGNTNTGVANANAITPVTPGAWIFVAAGAAVAAGAVFTNPVGMSTTTNHFRSATITSTTNDANIAGALYTGWTSGAYDPAVFGGSTSTNTGSWSAVTIALRPYLVASGSLSVTESGADTASLTGDVIVQGPLAATESGVDTASMSGTGGDAAITGTLGAVETGADTVGGGVAVTWNPSDKGVFITLSNGNLTATGTDTSNSSGGTRSTTSKSSGKHSWRFTPTVNDTGNSMYVGVANASASASQRAGVENANGITLRLDASGDLYVYFNAAFQGVLGTWTIGDHFDVIWNDDTQTAWFAKNGTVLSGDPVAGTGGHNFSIGDGFAYLWISNQGSGTADFSVSGASGYSAWTPAGGITGKVLVQGAASATESGADTASLSGDVIVQGAFASSESGSDGAALTGTVPVTGALAATESGGDTAAVAGTVGTPAATGTLSATEVGSDTAALSGTIPIDGDLAATETGADTASFAGNVLVQGLLATVEAGADSASLSGNVRVVGALGATESGSDVAATQGRVFVSGALIAAETGQDITSITGGGALPAITGNIEATESWQDTASLSGDVIVQGALAASDSGSDIASFSGAVRVAGSLASVETASDTATISGVVPIAGQIAANDNASDIASFSGVIPVRGSFTAVETGADTASLTGGMAPVTGALAAVEFGADTASFSGNVAVAGSLGADEATSDIADFSGLVLIQGSLGATETGQDTAAITAPIQLRATHSRPGGKQQAERLQQAETRRGQQTLMRRPVQHSTGRPANIQRGGR